MSGVEFDNNEEKRQPLTELALWNWCHALVADRRISGTYRNASGGEVELAVGQAIIWRRMAWVAVDESIVRQGLQYKISWQDASAEGTKIKTDFVVLLNGRLVGLDSSQETLDRVDYVLENTTFHDVEPKVRDGVAQSIGYIVPDAGTY